MIAYQNSFESLGCKQYLHLMEMIMQNTFGKEDKVD